MARRRRFKWRTVAAGLAVAGLVAVLAAWMMFQHIPAWYAPPAVGPEEEDLIWNDLLLSQNQLSEKLINIEGPFEHRFTAEQVNEWIAIREARWPEASHWLPEGVVDPFVTMDSDGIRLAVTVQRGRLQTVLSVRLQLMVTARGIEVSLGRFAAGSLGIPSTWLAGHLKAVDAQISQRADRRYVRGGSLASTLVLKEEFPWPFIEDQYFRIIDLAFEPGVCVVTLKALPDKGPHTSR